MHRHHGAHLCGPLQRVEALCLMPTEELGLSINDNSKVLPSYQNPDTVQVKYWPQTSQYITA